MPMSKEHRQSTLADLKADLPRLYPTLAAVVPQVLSVASQLAYGHHHKRQWEAMTVHVMNSDGEDVIRVHDEDDNAIANINSDDPAVAEMLVSSLKALRIPARLKETKLSECGGCDHYHPVDFHGDCRDDGNRFPTPNDYDDIEEEIED